MAISNTPSPISYAAIPPDFGWEKRKEKKLRKFDELGFVEEKEMALVIAAKQNKDKPYRNSIFIIDRLHDFLNAAIKLAVYPTKSSHLRFQYATRSFSHSNFGEVILDKSREKPHLKIFICDPSEGEEIAIKIAGIIKRSEFINFCPMKITILTPLQTEILQKGFSGCSYFSLDGAFLLSNQEQFENLYELQENPSDDFEIIGIPLPVRLKRGSHYIKDEAPILGIESSILNVPEHANKIVNRTRHENAKENIIRHLKILENGKIHNMRIEEKMKGYQKAVKQLLDQTSNHAELKKIIRRFSQEGFEDEYCSKEMI